MRRSLLHPRTWVPIGGAIALVAFVALVRTPTVQPLSDAGAIWVYYTSVCARAGDASDCAEVRGDARPAFVSLEACSEHRDRDLGQAGDPRLLGSCLRQREA